LPNSAATATSAFFEKRGLAEAGAQNQLDHDAPDSRERSRRARTTKPFCRKMFSVTPTSFGATRTVGITGRCDPSIPFSAQHMTQTGGTALTRYGAAYSSMF